MKIRSAAPGEASVLTALARRSKAYWGYSDSFMAACEAELTITANRITHETCLVAEEDDEIVGMAGIAECDDGWEICNMFVAPEHIGTGVGGRLCNALIEAAKGMGISELQIDADPNARPFYERMGAVYHSMTPSESIAGREIPHLRLTISGTPSSPGG